MTCRSWLKKFGILVSVVLLLLLVAAFFPRQLLTVDSGSARAEVLVVLGGGGKERATRAGELFKANAAALIICTGSGDAGLHKAWLVSAGIPASVIELEDRSLTTRENARFTIAMLRARHVKSAIIVTSWYHSRRALACFEHYGPDLKFYSRPTYFGCQWADFKRHRLIDDILKEYVKTVGYWICYGIGPWPTP